jgi:hypothetical protein
MTRLPPLPPLAAFLAAALDDLAAQGHVGLEIGLVAAAADSHVILARPGFAPKGVPDGNLARIGNRRVELRLDQGLERLRGIRTGTGDRRLHEGVVLLDQEFQGRDQQRLLAGEVEVDSGS